MDEQGLQIVEQPQPEVPDDVADQANGVQITARFHVGPDGKVRVELIRPSAIPELNQCVLRTLSHWKFQPAVHQGQPVAATQDITLSF